MRIGTRLAVALAWLLAIPLALAAPPRCQRGAAADARLRLEVWGRGLAGAKSTVAAQAARRVAWVADRWSTVVKALFPVTPQEAGAPGWPGASANRLRWVRCAGDGWNTRWEANSWR